MQLRLSYMYFPTYENAYWCKVEWDNELMKESKSFCGKSFEEAKERALVGVKDLIERAKVNPAIPADEVIEC